MAGLIDRIGQRYGRLVVLSLAPPDGQRTRWLCQCDCDKQKIVRAGHLQTGDIRSCGCLSAELSAEREFKHGAAGRRTKGYMAWGSMLARCSNPNSHRWKQYGARGISVCEMWQKFPNFIADMGEPPPGLSIERLDNNGNYELGNCIWADAKTQARNRSTTKFITLRGERLSVQDACERHGISYHRVCGNMHPERANAISYEESFVRQIARVRGMDAAEMAAQIGLERGP